MKNLFVLLLIGLIIVVMTMLYRVIKGPTVYDRLNGLGVIGTSTILLLITIGFIDERIEMFVDIAISYSILGFISLIILSKYLSE